MSIPEKPPARARYRTFLASHKLPFSVDNLPNIATIGDQFCQFWNFIYIYYMFCVWLLSIIWDRFILSMAVVLFHYWSEFHCVTVSQFLYPFYWLTYIWVTSSFQLLGINLLWTFLYMHFDEYKHWWHLPGHSLYRELSLEDTAKWFSKLVVFFLMKPRLIDSRELALLFK